MSDPRLPWDAFQRDALDALGHVVYAVQAEPQHAAPRDAADAAAPPLLQAIARAARAHVAQLPALPPLERLRTPAAKRALWPQLRAWRKGPRP